MLGNPSKFWWQVVKVLGYTYFIPLESIQVLALRGRGEELFYGTLSEVHEMELTLNCRLEENCIDKSPVT
jgi:hypothetical protein